MVYFPTITAQLFLTTRVRRAIHLTKSGKNPCPYQYAIKRLKLIDDNDIDIIKEQMAENVWNIVSLELRFKIIFKYTKSIEDIQRIDIQHKIQVQEWVEYTSILLILKKIACNMSILFKY